LPVNGAAVKNNCPKVFGKRSPSIFNESGQYAADIGRQGVKDFGWHAADSMGQAVCGQGFPCSIKQKLKAGHAAQFLRADAAGGLSFQWLILPKTIFLKVGYEKLLQLAVQTV
jgi:hypothetical protein